MFYMSTRNVNGYFYTLKENETVNNCKKKFGRMFAGRLARLKESELENKQIMEKITTCLVDTTT